MTFKSQSTGYLANHLARLYAILLNEQMQPIGISTAQFPILLELWQQDGLTQNELVRLGNLAQATVANTLGRMERDGLITRIANQKDARVKHIMLTDKARKLESEAIACAKQVNQQSLAVLTEDEQQQFNTLMQKVIEKQREMVESE